MEGVKGVCGVVRLLVVFAVVEVDSEGSRLGGLEMSSLRSRGRSEGLEEAEAEVGSLLKEPGEVWSGCGGRASAMADEKIGESRSGKLPGHAIMGWNRGDGYEISFMPVGKATWPTSNLRRRDGSRLRK